MNLDTASLRSRLKLKKFQAQNQLEDHHPHVAGLLKSAGIQIGSLSQHAAKLLASGAVMATVTLSSPQSAPIKAALTGASPPAIYSVMDIQKQLSDQLKEILSPEIVNLKIEQEKKVTKLLHDYYGIHASAELEGNRLNDTYGYIGCEQHLPRFPGDSVSQHDAVQTAGITPGRGAWGYFAWSKKDLTPDLITEEKYYVAVQTLYLPDWSARLAYLRDWYKYRKVIVVNPKNGKTVVAVIADSGPSWWTGKKFGGSPEVMDYLQLQDGRQKGAVVVFFVDDPGNQVPLGPLEYNLENQPKLIEV